MSDDEPKSMPQILAEMELLSHGSTYGYNSSGGGSDSPDNRIVFVAAQNLSDEDRGYLHLVYREAFRLAVTDEEREALIIRATAALREARRRIIPVPEKVKNDAEIQKERVLKEGRGWSTADVARHLRMLERDVRKIRQAESRDEYGFPTIVLAPVDDKAEQVRELLANGMTERQVVALTGVPKSTVRRLAGRAA